MCLDTLISGGSRVSATNVQTHDPPKNTSSSKYACAEGVPLMSLSYYIRRQQCVQLIPVTLWKKKQFIDFLIPYSHHSCHIFCQMLIISNDLTIPQRLVSWGYCNMRQCINLTQMLDLLKFGVFFKHYCLIVETVNISNYQCQKVFTNFDRTLLAMLRQKI